MKNKLANETSPYLKMHSENPVEWYPWGKEALEKAKNEHRPILLSIGYTACHWCHVMAHESFEDVETAQLMNKYFVNIKVDREERPDLDKIYQLSAQLLTRQVGGWPLTIFLMPNNQIPFFAGTYFPKNRLSNYPSFKEVIQYVNNIFNQKQTELQQQNASFEGIINELEIQSELHADTLSLSPLHAGFKYLEASYDRDNGGFGKAPKFPMTSALQLLLLNWEDNNPNAKEMLMNTVNKILQGGIYDQVGDGFFRYTVDEKWQIPHFEKMLYDNALLLTLLSETYALMIGENIKEESKKSIVAAMSGTAEWLIKEMQSAEGGYYSSLSADTEGKEGLFYIWNREEIKEAVTSREYEALNLYFGLERPANFQRSWHLNVSMPLNEVAKKLHRNEHEVMADINLAKEKLYARRSKRPKPVCDEKIIVSWNGLAIKAMAMASFYLKENKYLNSAKQSLNFICKNLWRDNKLFSVYKDGQIKQPANLDDYVFLIEGIIALLQVEWSNEYFIFLKNLIEKVLEDFEDKKVGGFYFTANDHEKLIYRVKQYTDEALPSSNATLTKLLLQVGFLLGENKFILAAENSLKNVFPHLQKAPDYYCSFLQALSCYLGITQIIIVRADSSSMSQWSQVLLENYHTNRLGFCIPDDVVLSSPLDIKKSGETPVAYLCLNHECMPPFINTKDLAHELRSNKFRLTK